MTGAEHPGTVELVDEEKGTTKVLAVNDVPESVAFVDGNPVVRVVHKKRGAEHVVQSFDADGNLLATTVGRG